MKISDILKSEKAVLSFEVFPPKTSDKYESLYNFDSKAFKGRFGRYSVGTSFVHIVG
jgi:5,10-methylenetetrahydrofolate reductase